MAGIRIRHSVERNATMTVVDASRPYQRSFLCLAPIIRPEGSTPCGRTHAFKTYHLNLDDQGTTIVSREIWDRIARLPGRAGFAVSDVVVDPPSQTVRIPAMVRIARSIAPGLGR